MFYGHIFHFLLKCLVCYTMTYHIVLEYKENTLRHTGCLIIVAYSMPENTQVAKNEKRGKRIPVGTQVATNEI